MFPTKFTFIHQSFTAVVDELTCDVVWLKKDGDYLDLSENGNKPILVAVVKGPCRNILMAERTVLNTMSRGSGVATQVLYFPEKQPRFVI